MMLLRLFQGMDQIVKELLSASFVIARHQMMLYLVPDILDVGVFFYQCSHGKLSPTSIPSLYNHMREAIVSFMVQKAFQVIL